MPTQGVLALDRPGSVCLTTAWLGRVGYPAAWARQRELFLARLEREVEDALLLLEHPHTYTLGRRGIEADLVWDESMRAARDIALFHVDRGGRATYHGPGQLVGYPILELGERYDVLDYLRKLEKVLIRTAADLGVEATRDGEHTGVWVGKDKIGAIGVKITRGITMHGFAFNVSTDLSMFEGIVPCGIHDRWVTSVQEQTGKTHSLKEVGAIAAKHVAEIFGRALVWTHPRILLPPETPSYGGVGDSEARERTPMRSKKGPSGPFESAHNVEDIVEKERDTNCTITAMADRVPTKA